MPKTQVKLQASPNKREYAQDEPILLLASITNGLDASVYVVTEILRQYWEEAKKTLHLSLAASEPNIVSTAFFRPPLLEMIRPGGTTELELTVQLPMREIVFERQSVLVPQEKETNPTGKFKIIVTVGYGLHPFESPNDEQNLRKEFIDWQLTVTARGVSITRHP